MLVKLNKLNESLENKYLNEAFSDMPEWFKERMLDIKTHDAWYGAGHGEAAHEYGKNARKRKPKSLAPDYAGRGYQWSADRGEKNLFTRMKKDLALDKLEIIECPVPSKSTDPRFKEPNIPIFLFPNGQVYVKGYNPDEMYADYENPGGWKEAKAFKYLSIKYLKDHCVKFAYIDGNNDDNFIKDKKDKRYSSKVALRNAYPERHPEYAGRNRRDERSGKYRDFDKSGYAVIPPVDKYKKELQRLKGKKIYDQLDEAHDYLIFVKDELANIFSNIDIDADEDQSKAYFNSLRSYFLEAIDDYRYVVKMLDNMDEFVDNPNDDDQKLEYIRQYIISDYHYRDLVSNIETLKERSGEIFNSVIDWI